jgi:hypothetical protein
MSSDRLYDALQFFTRLGFGVLAWARVIQGNTSRPLRSSPRPVRNTLALLLLIPALASADDATQSESVDDFYITITANELCLCGEGFGGIYGCIDEAVSRQVKSVVVSASSEASSQAVQELVNAVHAVGFDQVGVTTFDESYR